MQRVARCSRAGSPSSYDRCARATSAPAQEMLGATAYTPEQLDRIMESMPTTEIWGIAVGTGKKLAARGFYTVKGLRDSDPKHIRQKFAVVQERTTMELRGVTCIELEEQPRELKDH